MPPTMFMYIGPKDNSSTMSLYKCLLGCESISFQRTPQKYLSCSNTSRHNLLRHVKVNNIWLSSNLMFINSLIIIFHRVNIKVILFDFKGSVNCSIRRWEQTNNPLHNVMRIFRRQCQHRNSLTTVLWYSFSFLWLFFYKLSYQKL